MKKGIMVFLTAINLLSFSNNKKMVCLDPGHQLKGSSKLEPVAPNSTKKKARVSSGTQGVSTKKNEYELTLEIGLKLKQELLKKGYDVFMTREKHNINISNMERAIMTNNKRCDVYIRIHADGSENRNIQGASVLTSSPKNPYTKKVQKESEIFSKILLEEYVKETKAKNRGVIYRDDLTGTNWSQKVNTLIEMGYMSNPEEDRRMSDKEYQKKMINGIVNGIDKYLKK